MSRYLRRLQRENERDERKQREHQDRMDRERDRQETRAHREWQREEAARRSLERENRRSYRDPAPAPYVPPRAPAPTQQPKSAPKGANPLVLLAAGVALLGVAASIASAAKPSSGGTSRSSDDMEFHCRPAPKPKAATPTGPAKTQAVETGVDGRLLTLLPVLVAMVFVLGMMIGELMLRIRDLF